MNAQPVLCYKYEKAVVEGQPCRESTDIYTNSHEVNEKSNIKIISSNLLIFRKLMKIISSNVLTQMKSYTQKTKQNKTKNKQTKTKQKNGIKYLTRVDMPLKKINKWPSR